MSDDLKVLFPGRDIEIRDFNNPESGSPLTLRITPFTARQIPKVLAFVVNIRPLLQEAGGDALKLIALGGDSIFQIAAMAIGKPVEVFDKILPDDALTIISAVLEENYDFFSQRVAPDLKKLMGAISKSTPTAQTASEPSTQD